MEETMTPSQMGKKSVKNRKQKFGKDYPKLMSHMRKGKKLSSFKEVDKLVD